MCQVWLLWLFAWFHLAMQEVVLIPGYSFSLKRTILHRQNSALGRGKKKQQKYFRQCGWDPEPPFTLASREGSMKVLAESCSVQKYVQSYLNSGQNW